MSKILHLIHSTAFGGGPAMVELLCTRLNNSEFQMSLVSSGEGELPARLRALGIPVTDLPLSTKQSFLKNIPALARVLHRESPDLVHVHGHWAASFGQIAVQLAGRFPTIYSVQWPAYLDDTGLYSTARDWLAEALACRLASRVVAVANHDRETLVRRRLCAPQKLTVIYNSFDPNRFSADGPRPALPQRGRDIQAPSPTLPPRGREDSPVIGFVGRLADQKGCQYLIEAMPAVVAAHPKAILRIVGDGPERDMLTGMVHRLRLERSVEFLGYQPSSAEIFGAMDVMVVPSIYDVHPLVTVEAMACGLPVIASAVGGLPETVVEGKTGLLVPPRNPAQLASAINRLLESDALRRAMGAEARKRAEELFSPQACVAAYAREYRALLARPRRAAPRT